MVRYVPPPESIKERLFIVLGCIAWFVVFWGSGFLIIMENRERQSWEKRFVSTEDLYLIDEVCEENGHILNCGNCGQCSNVADVQTYEHNKNSLASAQNRCGIAVSTIFGWNMAAMCLRMSISSSPSNTNNGFTQGCTDCMIENMQCTRKYCGKTCFKRKYLPFLPTLVSWREDAKDDPCRACEESFCSRGYLECAGANLRRIGVDTNAKNSFENCKKVDWDFIHQNGASSSPSSHTEL